MGVGDFLCKESVPARIQLTGNASSLLSFRVYIILAPYPVNFFLIFVQSVLRETFFFRVVHDADSDADSFQDPKQTKPYNFVWLAS